MGILLLGGVLAACSSPNPPAAAPQGGGPPPPSVDTTTTRRPDDRAPTADHLAVPTRDGQRPVCQRPDRHRRHRSGHDPDPAARTPRHPAIDCFYVYPTVSTQTTANANLTIDPEETAVAVAQAARFSQVCNVYAPVYRQLTAAAIAGKAAITEADIDLAYEDVLSAWKYYLDHYNDGRGVAFIGHSQGATMLIKLLQTQVDSNPLGALPPGVGHPAGWERDRADRADRRRHVRPHPGVHQRDRPRLCHRLLELRPGSPGELALRPGVLTAQCAERTDGQARRTGGVRQSRGRHRLDPRTAPRPATDPDRTTAGSTTDDHDALRRPDHCTVEGQTPSQVAPLVHDHPGGEPRPRPARPRSRSQARCRPTSPPRRSPAPPSPPEGRGRRIKLTTPWVTFPGLYEAQCKSQGGATWLQVDSIARPADTRPVVKETLGPTWGLHLVDVNIALGNLVDDLQQQADNYSTLIRRAGGGRRSR